MITINWTLIGLNWTVSFKCLEIAFVVIKHYINKPKTALYGMVNIHE